MGWTQSLPGVLLKGDFTPSPAHGAPSTYGGGGRAEAAVSPEEPRRCQQPREAGRRHNPALEQAALPPPSPGLPASGAAWQ